MIQNVLRAATAADVRREPFAYLVVEDCLPPDLYGELARTYPSDASVLDQNPARRDGRIRSNQRNDISAHRVLGRGSVPDCWEAFVRAHTSADFYRDVVRVFGPALRGTYPDLEARLGARLDELRTGVRFDPASDTGDISLDCQIGINTAVMRKGSVRGVHADAPEELFAMLLYFRRDEDDSVGGDLEIWRWKPGRRPAFIGSEASERDAEYVTTIPYRANTLVAFINSENALHAVSARSVTPHSRRLVNIIGEVYRPLPQGLFVKRQKPFGKVLRKLRLGR